MTPESWAVVAAVAASVAALATAVTAVVTIFYANFTLRLVWAQLDPKVILFVRHDETRPTAITLVVENIGRDIAQDVRFFASRPLPEKAFGMPGREIQPADEMRTGPLVSGIPALAPGDQRLVLWGQYAGLKKALGSEPIVVRFTYRSGTRRLFFFGERKFTGETTLEIDSFAQTDASEPPVLTVANQLKRIATALERRQSTTLTSGDDLFGDKTHS